MIKAKDCPFCGWPEIKVLTQDLVVWTQCKNCGARGPVTFCDVDAPPAGHDVENSIRKWNQRGGMNTWESEEKARRRSRKRMS